MHAPNSDLDGNPSPTLGVVLNPRRRNELARLREIEENEYLRLQSRRPASGSGQVGGDNLLLRHHKEYVPSDREVMEMMQLMDIEWVDAYACLKAEYDECNPQKARGSLSQESELIRHQRIQAAAKASRLKEKQRKKSEEDEKKRHQEALDRKKKQARAQGELLDRKRALEIQRLQRQSEATRNERLSARLSKFDEKPDHIHNSLRRQSESNRSHVQAYPLSMPGVHYTHRFLLPDPRSNDSLETNDVTIPHSPASDQSFESPHLFTEHSGHISDDLQHIWLLENRIEELTMNNLVLEAEIDQLRRTRHQGPPLMPQPARNYPVHTVTSQDWRELLNCPSVLREQVIRSMCEEVAKAEAGEGMFPSLEYIISCEKDRISEKVSPSDSFSARVNSRDEEIDEANSGAPKAPLTVDEIRQIRLQRLAVSGSEDKNSY